LVRIWERERRKGGKDKTEIERIEGEERKNRERDMRIKRES